jgi:hypothetical protein
MLPAVYLETSVIGYLASRRSADPIVAGNQQATLDWWKQRERFDVYVSEAVVDECSAGDPTAVAERLVFLRGIPELDISFLAKSVAGELIRVTALPVKAHVDALHIAIAAASGMDYLLTWNCRHIANASLRRRIEEVLASFDLAAPVICTPQELTDVE